MLKKDLIKWLMLYKKVSVKASTFATYCKTAKNYIIPKFGEDETKNITSEDVMELLFFLQHERELSFSTVKKVYNLLGEFFKYAQKNNLCTTNIMEDVICKKIDQPLKEAPRALTIEEIQRFNEVALMPDEMNKGKIYNYHFGPALVIYLNTGMRLGELVSLKRSDYNSKTGELNIHSDAIYTPLYQKLSYDELASSGNKILYQNSPKSRESNRTIRVNATTRELLNYYYRISDRYKSDYIFTNLNGEPASPNSMKTTYYNVVKRAHIHSAKGIHTLRHTCATHLLHNDVDVKVVSKLLGHATTSFTYDVYIHLFENDVPDALKTLDKVFA